MDLNENKHILIYYKIITKIYKWLGRGIKPNSCDKNEHQVA